MAWGLFRTLSLSSTYSASKLLLELVLSKLETVRAKKIRVLQVEILTFQLEKEKLFRFDHIGYVVKTELFFLFKFES